MKKAEKIREMMEIAYSGGCYHRGIVQRGRKYVYFLDSAGNIERCHIRLYDANSPVWEMWGHDTDVIAALAGRDVTRYCVSVSMDSLFAPGGTKSPWEVYVDRFNAPFISNI